MSLGSVQGYHPSAVRRDFGIISFKNALSLESFTEDRESYYAYINGLNKHGVCVDYPQFETRISNLTAVRSAWFSLMKWTIKLPQLFNSLGNGINVLFDARVFSFLQICLRETSSVWGYIYTMHTRWVLLYFCMTENLFVSWLFWLLELR